MKLSRVYEVVPPKAALALAFSALAFSVSAGAEVQKPQYTMTAIVDASYGSAVRSGKYERAIQRITAPGYHRKDSFAATTNLCVAYTKTGAIGEAAMSCEAAVSGIRTPAQGTSRAEPAGALSNRELAVALSNRGVVRAVRGETALARQDFIDAVELDTGLAAPSVNLTRLEAADGIESYVAE